MAANTRATEQRVFRTRDLLPAPGMRASFYKETRTDALFRFSSRCLSWETVSWCKNKKILELTVTVLGSTLLVLRSEYVGKCMAVI